MIKIQYFFLKKKKRLKYLLAKELPLDCLVRLWGM